MNGDSLVRARSLHRRYGSLHAVKGIDLEVGRGEVLGLLGPNGAGKTTTMQMLCGALAPSAGRIVIDGADLLEAPRRAKRKIGYLPERLPLYLDLNVDEYLRYCARLKGVDAKDVRGAVERVKSRCGLTEVGRRLIGNLSRGYQQRAGIAQAIVHRPPAVVLDEPTLGLDPSQIREIRALIGELGEEHAVILSTHILPEVQSVCHRVQILVEGRIVLNERLDALDCSSVALRAGFRRPPSIESLEALAGVTRVEPIDAERVRLVHEEVAELAEMIVERSAAEGWRLFELVPEQRALEEIFISLTHGEGDAGVAAATGGPDA